uniref:(northern house mosquito) hypothetical protein n=1 Tax=Culex pipiens TaxID=7175 RepID=A0A8D8KZD6_CULPI
MMAMESATNLEGPKFPYAATFSIRTSSSIKHTRRRPRNLPHKLPDAATVKFLQPDQNPHSHAHDDGHRICHESRTAQTRGHRQVLRTEPEEALLHFPPTP